MPHFPHAGPCAAQGLWPCKRRNDELTADLFIILFKKGVSWSYGSKLKPTASLQSCPVRKLSDWVQRDADKEANAPAQACVHVTGVDPTDQRQPNKGLPLRPRARRAPLRPAWARATAYHGCCLPCYNRKRRNILWPSSPTNPLSRPPPGKQRRPICATCSTVLPRPSTRPQLPISTIFALAHASLPGSLASHRATNGTGSTCFTPPGGFCLIAYGRRAHV